ncbi:hypothetical protein N657DRAFT_630017 [Parathielavia appendiculata]|uniref:Uncharacterized protein n=1 Tax=Parathielavia appendiculata TaxID=2587402 RepID=A0AAN6Z8N3_9PEZI|nr:hypothetical protein N657DRAFT_630017 [Parathielavia appendiculata]
MDYTRQSSQPATVDLVRADLAEFWAIDESDADCPKKPPSISGISDMLDFEYIPTPRARPSRAMRKDPLPVILGNYLETSPTRKEGRNETREKPSSNKPLTKQNIQSRNQDSTASDRRSTPIGPDCPSQVTRKLGHSSGMETPVHRKNKRKLTSRPNATDESQPRRQPQSDRKPVASSAAGKGSTKTSKQTKTLPETPDPASTRAKPKTRKRDDHLFELSDGTESEAEARPKKRQASASRKPPIAPARTSQTTGRAQGGKPARVPKKPTTHVVSQIDKAEHDPPDSNTAPHGNDGTEQEAEPQPYDHRSTSPDSAKSESVRKAQMDQQAPMPQGADTPEFTSPEPAKVPPVAPRECIPVVPDSSPHRDVIILSSESPEASNAAAGSTSRLFVEQDQGKPTRSLAPAVAITDNTCELNPNETSPTRLPRYYRRHGFTPPPSFQPRVLGNNAAFPQRLNTDRPLPADTRGGFYSDEQQATTTSSSVREQEPCPAHGGSSPEDMWSQVVQDDSPPAILHRIVSLLHRSLKPREEVVRDIVADYQDNAFRLLDNLSGRHDQERTETLVALRQASRAAFSVFSGAGHDMAVFINKLRDMDVTHTAHTLTRRDLARKLHTVAQLSQTKLGSYVRDEPFGGDAASKFDGGGLDVLAETYRLKLLDAVQRPDGHVSAAVDGVDMRVDDSIKRYLRGETRKVHRPEVSQLKKPARNADEALEVFLDGILGTLQENKDRVSPSSA